MVIPLGKVSRGNVEKLEELSRSKTGEAGQNGHGEALPPQHPPRHEGAPPARRQRERGRFLALLEHLVHELFEIGAGRHDEVITRVRARHGIVHVVG